MRKIHLIAIRMLYDKENIFAQIIKKESPAKIVYEDEKLMCFYTIEPKADTHVLIIPKAEFISYEDFIEKSSDEDIAYFFRKIREIAKILSIENTYRLITNHGKGSNQVVFHFHFHMLGGNIQEPDKER